MFAFFIMCISQLDQPGNSESFKMPGLLVFGGLADSIQTVEVVSTDFWFLSKPLMIIYVWEIS